MSSINIHICQTQNLRIYPIIHTQGLLFVHHHRLKTHIQRKLTGKRNLSNEYIFTLLTPPPKSYTISIIHHQDNMSQTRQFRLRTNDTTKLQQSYKSSLEQHYPYFINKITNTIPFKNKKQRNLRNIFICSYDYDMMVQKRCEKRSCLHFYLHAIRLLQQPNGKKTDKANQWP